MAKWGEGDPRWIVEERPDATNVNNWHWTEKNATTWSKERFGHLFNNFKIDDENIVCTIKEMEKCSGEASVNNRKGKLIFFFEWDIIFKWEGSFKSGSSSTCTGKISIPNLSEENELKDIEITITIDESNDSSENLKKFMYDVGREKIRIILGVYVTELKEEYSRNLILPIKSTVSEKGRELPNNQFNIVEQAKSAITSNASDCKLDERSIDIEEEFKCSARDLYDVLTNKSMVEIFTRGPANVDAKQGGHFALYGGHVHGYFEELIPEKKIFLKWRLKSWPKDHYSKVVIELEEMKLKKPREANCSASEKECLRECVNAHLDVVDNRGNDISLIQKKKKNTWKAIKETMLSLGYDREICKLKAQWVRMKVSTKKSVANIKRATIATGNSVTIPELSAEETLIEGMIAHELEEDTILIDSNSCFNEISHEESNLHIDLIEEEDLASFNTPPKYTAKGIKEDKKYSSAIKELRSLPNASYKNGVLIDRQRQISKEIENADENFKLQMKQLKVQIEHQARMHKKEEELISLKIFPIQREIEHKEELHVINLDNL